MEEVKQAINKLKNNRAPGPDIVNAELLKEENTVLFKKITYNNGKNLKIEEIPQDWEEDIICRIFKKRGTRM